MPEPRPAPPVAGYLAQPHEVHRVVLLYSGGLDTSVMLKWIQDEYDAEVIALCIDLGQPDDDFDAVRQKALDLGAVESLVVDAKEEFARDYVAPAIRANARYQGGYPLFTSLGRPLLAKLACEAAREHGADTIAHGCTGKGNDQVRIEATVATLAPDLKVIAPVREWQMGRDEEIAYAQEHGIPVASTVERPYSIDDNLWGRSSEGGVIEDLDRPPPEDVFQLVTPPTRAPDRPEEIVIGFRDGLPCSLDGRGDGAGRADPPRGRGRRAQRRGDRRPHRGPRRGAEGARHLRGPRRRDHPHRPPRAREAGLHGARERAEAAARRALGPARLRGALVRAPARRPQRLHGAGQPARRGRDHDAPLQGRAPPPSRAARPTRSTTAAWRPSTPTPPSRRARRPGFIELFSLQSRMAHRIADARERG